MGSDNWQRVAQSADSQARLGRLFFADDFEQLVVGGVTDALAIEGGDAGQQLIQQHAERVDVAASVDVQLAHTRLFGAHVKRGAHHLAEAGKERLLGQPGVRRFGHAEVDYLGNRRIVTQRDHHIRRLDVAVDNSLLVGVLNSLANQNKELQTFSSHHIALIAEVRDRNATDQLHNEVRPARLGCSGVEDLSDVGMVHDRQRLAFGLESGDDLLGIHPRLDDLQSHLAANRLLLFGHEDHAKTAFADLLQEFVAADNGAGALGDGWGEGGVNALRRRLQKAARIRVRPKEDLHSLPQIGVTSADSVQKGVTPILRLFQGLVEDFFFLHACSPRAIRGPPKE